MTAQELDAIKRLFKQLHEAHKDLWMEKEVLRNLIIDSGWMAEKQLALAVERGKGHPHNIREADKAFSANEQMLAEIGIDDWLANFERQFPSCD